MEWEHLDSPSSVSTSCFPSRLPPPSNHLLLLSVTLVKSPAGPHLQPPALFITSSLPMTQLYHLKVRTHRTESVLFDKPMPSVSQVKVGYHFILPTLEPNLLAFAIPFFSTSSKCPHNPSHPTPLSSCPSTLFLRP